MADTARSGWFGPATVIGGVFAVAALASVDSGGRSDVGLADLADLLSGGGDEIGRSVMRDLRLPRSVVAALIGINLSLAGLILQAITRNPLASPSVLGTNQGAALGLVASLVFPGAAGLTLDAMAIAGAMGAAALTFAIAGGFSGRIAPLRLVLGGVAVGAFAFAAVRFSYTLDDDLTHTVVRWTVGDIAGKRWRDAAPLAVWSLGGLAATLLLSHRLNMMALGEASARGLGADPRVTLLLGALTAAVLVGTSVTIAGPVAFVGLVVPHVARAVFGADIRMLAPASAAMGAALMLLADALSKWLASPAEIPVGLVAALIGAPYFLYLTLFSERLE